MAKGLVIPLSLDPREWIRGIERVERSLEAMEDDLEEVEDVGDRLGRKLEDAFDDAARESDTFGRSAKSDMDKVGRAAEGVEDDIGDIEDEANQSAKEFGAAFRGDPLEALEEVQSYLSEIVAVKLPGFAGALATVAGGAAIGLIVQGVEKWREKQERINEIATEYVGIIQAAADGPLSQTNRAYDDLIDKQIALAVLEEASAEQLTNLAVLAAARGETTEEYVNNVLTGEVNTQEQLAGIQAERNAIADELLRITTDSNTANDEQIPLLKAQDASLASQGAALRSVGGFINENVAGYGKAKAAQDAVATATDAAKEKQRALNRVAAEANVDGLVSGLETSATTAATVRDRVAEIREGILNLPDLDIGVTQQTANSLARLARLYAE